jgi:putative endonuclease
VRVGRYEIDLVARAGDLAAVVEVRTRGEGSFEGALESVDARKRSRLVRAANGLWLSALRNVAGLRRMRFDVAAVHFDGPAVRVEYVEAAFTT